MQNVKLPHPLRKKIREYFKTIMQTNTQQQELDSFMKSISPGLASKVRVNMFEKLLRDKNKIIKETQKMILDAQGVSQDKSKKNLPYHG